MAPYPDQAAQASSAQTYQATSYANSDGYAPPEYQAQKSLNISQIMPADEVWCRKPETVRELQDSGNAVIYAQNRRQHEMQVETGILPANSPIVYKGFISSIVDMKAEPHHCYEFKLQECEDPNLTHLCNALVNYKDSGPRRVRFSIKGDNADDAVWVQEPID